MEKSRNPSDIQIGDTFYHYHTILLTTTEDTEPFTINKLYCAGMKEHGELLYLLHGKPGKGICKNGLASIRADLCYKDLDKLKANLTELKRKRLLYKFDKLVAEKERIGKLINDFNEHEWVKVRDANKSDEEKSR